jgi:hypothetical protein
MANVVLPSFPALAAGAIFIKGFANNGTVATPAEYVTFGHSFRLGQLPQGGGLAADFGAGSVQAQLDVKTSYADGSAAHALVTVPVPAMASGTTTWGQFSSAGAPETAASLPTVPNGTTLSISLAATALSGWTAATAEAAGAVIAPASGNTGLYSYQCTTPGTTGSTAPTWPQALGDTVTDGTVTWTNIGANFSATLTQDLIALFGAATPNPWLSGALAAQGRATAILYEGLRVQIDLTAYANGTVLADVMVANDVAMLPVGGAVSYTATITLNGAAAYASPALTHYQYQNWTASVGTAPVGLQVIHNPGDFIEAQAVQSYDTTLGVASTTYATAQGYVAASGFGEPLANPVFGGNSLVDEQMGATGGRPDIGANDAWTAWWLVTQDPTFEAVSLECGKVCGAVPWHLWSEATGQFMTTDDYPDLWADPRGAPDTLTQPIPTYTGWTLDSAHFPDLVYINYLLTGRRYFLDELNATSSWMMLDTYPVFDGGRNDGQGLVVSGGTVRGAAWALRNILYSVYANPDDTVTKQYWRTMLDNNMYWVLTQIGQWTKYQGGVAGGSWGWFPNYGYANEYPIWEGDYLFSSVSLAAIMGHPAAMQFTEWLANFRIGAFLQQPSVFPPQDGVAYVLVVFQNPSAYWGSLPLPAPNWGCLESETAATGQSNVSDGVVTWAHSEGDYAQLGEISLANCVTLGLPNAQTALTWLDNSGAPEIDDADWAAGSLVRVLPRTLNESQILPHAAAPASTGAYANPLLGAVSAAATMVGGTLASDTMSGTVAIGRLAAIATLAVGRLAGVALGGAIAP